MKNLSYKKIGKGIPFVLVHGYLGGQNMWKFQEELKHDYELIMPSLAGYGESSHLIAPSTIRENAEQVFELLNHLNIDFWYSLPIHLSPFESAWIQFLYLNRDS